MRRTVQEFVTFLANHLRPVQAICQHRQRFASDDEVIAFLRSFEEEDKNLVKLVGRMREIGVLIDQAGEWAPPHYLSEFMTRLAERHTLAGPEVIKGWIETLRKHVRQLTIELDSAVGNSGLINTDQIQFLLNEISEVFHSIVGTVQANCERIASEVIAYRMIEDVGRLRGRLGRLVHLHDEYLEPIMRLIDVNGDFYDVTEQISLCCNRLVVLSEQPNDVLAQDAQFIRKDVVSLRRVAVRQAEEARHELAPLCEAAARENKISKGVNRALEAIRLGNWNLLDLERLLPVVDERDGTLFNDLVIERFLRMAHNVASKPVPRVPDVPPQKLELPITVEDLLDRLEIISSLEDLLAWVLDSYADTPLDKAVQLFDSLIERRPDLTRPTEERREYKRGDFTVNAAVWTWKGKKHGNPSEPTADGGLSARKTRGSVPIA